MAVNKDSTIYIISVAAIMSLVAATVVSVAAVGLKPIQDANAAAFKKKNILIAAGIYDPKVSADKLFDDNMETVVISLKTGLPTDKVNVDTFDAIAASKDPKLGVSLKDDPAKIGFISKYATVYKLKDGDKVTRVILPIRGYGLWGTMYGFLAMNMDGRTVEGITFYDQKETPGLGAEITNPKWQATWVGKRPYGDSDTPIIKLVKSMSTDPKTAATQVDSLAGATLTSRGVQSTIRFWLGNQGYGPFLNKLAK